MLRSKIVNVVIASTSYDIDYLKSLDRNKLQNMEIWVTSLEAKNALADTSIPFKELASFTNSINLKNLYRETATIKSHLLENQILSEIFDFEGENIFSYLSYEIDVFIERMINGYQNIMNLKKRLTVFKLMLFKRNIENFLLAPLYADFNSLAFDLWSKVNSKTKIRILEAKVDSFNKRILPQLPRSILKASCLFYSKKYPSQQRRVVFVLPGVHAAKMINIFKTLEEMGVSYSAVIHNLSLNDLLTLVKNKVSFVERDSLKTREAENRANKFCQKIIRRLKSRKNDFYVEGRRDKKEMFLNKALDYRAWHFARFEIKTIIRDLLIAENFLRKVSPSVLITTTDPNIKVTPFINTAKKLGIRTITIQHGTYAWKPGTDFLSDEIVVWGKFYKKWFGQYFDKIKKKIAVCGSPFFDNLRVSAFSKNKFYKKARPSFLILLSAPPFVFLSEENDFNRLVQALVKLGANYVFVRTHPWQSIADLRIGSSLKKERVVAANNKDLEYYLSKSDIAITMNTTAGFNALIAGKKVIYWDIEGNENIPFRIGGVPVAKSIDEVISISKGTIEGKIKWSDQKRRKLIKDIFYKLDGMSGMRIAGKIIEEIKHGK